MKDMNKRGQFGLLALGILGVIAIILIAVLYFSTTFRYLTIGIALGVMSFIVLLKGNIKNERAKIGIFLGLLLIGSVLIFSSGTLQSIISVDKVTEISGEPFWLASGVANNVDDGFQFNFKGSNYELKDGSGEYKPQKAVTVFIDKSYSGCNYQLNKVTQKTGFFNTLTAEYYTLSNPDREAKISVSISGGNNPIVMDAFNDRRTIKEAFGDGEITVETLGLISSAQDCPESSNIVYVGEKFYFKNELENFYQDFNGISFINLNLPRTANTFTSEFNEGTLKATSNELSGELDIGGVLYTLEANADIFDSVFVIADQVADPSITSVESISDIKVGDTSNMIVNLRNSGEEGRVIVTADSNDFSISPSSRSITLDSTSSVTFTIIADNTEKTGKIEVEACGSSQFSTTQNCDSFTKSISIVAEDLEVDFCGDGICQSYETDQSCQEDCKILTDPNTQEETICQWYQEEYTKTEVDYGTGYWRAYTPFVEPITTEEQACKNAGWLNWIFISIIIISLGIIAIYSTKPKKKRK